MGFYKVEIKLGTPLAFQSRGVFYPPVFDAILTYLKAARAGVVGAPSLEQIRQGIQLPLASLGKKYPYYKASCLFVERPAAQDYFFWTKADAWLQDAFRLTEKCSKLLHKQPNLGGGPYRRWLNGLLLISTPQVGFYFDGDKTQVADLLQDLTHLGVRRAAGFGQVVALEIKETSRDFSCFDALNRPLRPIPVVEYADYEDDNTGNPPPQKDWPRAVAGYRPPYYHPEFRTLCYMPVADNYWPLRKEPYLPIPKKKSREDRYADY